MGEGRGAAGFLRGVAILLAAWTWGVAVVSGGEPLPEAGRLRAHVATLASAGYGGRPPGHARTVAYVREAFRELKLEPLFSGGYEQAIIQDGKTTGVNVGGAWRGREAGEGEGERWVILAAHHDHLGTRAGVRYPGADDNATAVAMLLETARVVARSGERHRRSVAFLSFDEEEEGLIGSKYFCGASPIPLERVDLFVTADMLGRALGGVCRGKVFVFGTEHAPGVRGILDRAVGMGRGSEVLVVGHDLLVMDRSDYGPFRERRVPFLFFSTGENPCYHRPEDRSETIDYAGLESHSRIMCELVRLAAEAEEGSWSWTERPEPPRGEAAAVRDVLKVLLEHGRELRIGKPQEMLMRVVIADVDRAERAGRALSSGERARLVRVAQLVLYTVL
jgi:hypothetical protein